MKYYRQTCYVMWGFLLLTLGILTYQVFRSGLEGYEHCKQEAEHSLRTATELWINLEFDKLGIPYSYGGGRLEVKSKKHPIVLVEGETAVAVESVKKGERLIASWILNSKARVLFLLNEISFSHLNELWQEDLEDIHPYCSGHLMLQSELPGDRTGGRFMAGNSMLMANEHKLGTYYLDDMYFLELTAYLAVPSPWLCTDWGECEIIVNLVVVILCLCILAFFVLRSRTRDDKNETNSSDDFVIRISERRYQISGVLFDEEAGTLTFGDQSEVKCPMQSYKLLSAFVHAVNHFLSNNRIVEVCGWSLKDTGINVKRRGAVSQLRKLLDCEKSHVKVESGKNKQNEFGFYLLASK